MCRAFTMSKQSGLSPSICNLCRPQCGEMLFEGAYFHEYIIVCFHWIFSCHPKYYISMKMIVSLEMTSIHCKGDWCAHVRVIYRLFFICTYRPVFVYNTFIQTCIYCLGASTIITYQVRIRCLTVSWYKLFLLQNFMNIDGRTLILFFSSPPFNAGPQKSRT